MRVLVACEFSGVVRDAFLARGHDATSCDLLPTETPGPHYEGDVLDILDQDWDLLIAHPPCTYLTHSGFQWLHGNPARWDAMIEAAGFFNLLLNAPAPRVAVENPMPHRYARELIGRPTQYVQPHEYGALETKKTGLWLRGLPPLMAYEDAVAVTMARPAKDRMPGWWEGPGPDRAKNRSRTQPGIAAAMATQWSDT